MESNFYHRPREFQISRRTDQAGEPLESFEWHPPKDSDELFMALKSAFPRGKTHRARLREALMEFLVSECEAERDTNSAPHIASLPGSGTTNHHLSALSSVIGSSNPSVKTGRSISTASSSAHNKIPSRNRVPKAWDGMTVVWTKKDGIARKTGPKRAMTEQERADYQLRRAQGACAVCKKKKRKCTHDSPAPQRLQLENPSPTKLDATTDKSTAIPQVASNNKQIHQQGLHHNQIAASHDFDSVNKGDFFDIASMVTTPTFNEGIELSKPSLPDIDWTSWWPEFVNLDSYSDWTFDLALQSPPHKVKSRSNSATSCETPVFSPPANVDSAHDGTRMHLCSSSSMEPIGLVGSALSSDTLINYQKQQRMLRQQQHLVALQHAASQGSYGSGHGTSQGQPPVASQPGQPGQHAPVMRPQSAMSPQSAQGTTHQHASMQAGMGVTLPPHMQQQLESTQAMQHAMSQRSYQIFQSLAPRFPLNSKPSRTTILATSSRTPRIRIESRRTMRDPDLRLRSRPDAIVIKLFLSGLAEKTRVLTLRARFLYFAFVQEAAIIQDIDTNFTRGFIIFQFENIRHADMALSNIEDEHESLRSLFVSPISRQSTNGEKLTLKELTRDTRVDDGASAGIDSITSEISKLQV